MLRQILPESRYRMPSEDTDAASLYWRGMYGPLNGVRAALVTLAVLAALAAAILGHWIVTLVLGMGVALHGLGWLYLAQQAKTESTDH